MDTIRWLADPVLVAEIQQFFGVEYIKPGTCDQQTQTKRPSVESLDDSTARDGQTPLVTECEHTTSSEKCLVCHQNSPSSGISPSSARLRGQKCKRVEPNNNGFVTDVSDGQTSELIDDARQSKNGFKNGHSNGHSTFNHCDKGVSQKGGIPAKENWTSVDENSIKPESDQAIIIKYKSLFYLARFGAFLGNEEFYLTFFPFVIWNLDALVVRQVSLLWALVMYMGQATKDYLRWPRPQCPPVIRLETNYIQEWSMPSTHAMAGTAIPMYLAYLAIVRYQVPFAVAASLALVWFSVTCFSRLYLGVHTVLDLIAGTLYAVILFVTFIRYVEDYDLYQQTHPFAPVMVLTTGLLLCTVFYPKIDKISAKGDAVQIVSGVAGCSIGAWIAFQYDITHEPDTVKPYQIDTPTLMWVGLALMRFISGLIVLGVTYLSLKKVTVQSFSYLYGLDVPDRKNPSVMTAYKFTTYFALGLLIAFVVPMMHVWMGIGRASFFSEVL